VRKLISLSCNCSKCPHRKGEWFVLLNQVQKSRLSQIHCGLMSDMSRPPGSCDEYVFLADHQRNRPVKSISHLDAVKQTLESLKTLNLPLPQFGHVFAIINHNDSNVEPHLRKHSGKIKLGNITAKKVLELDRRDQEINAPWRRGGYVQFKRRDLL